MGCKSDSEKARATLNNAHIPMREEKGEEAKRILNDLLNKYPHTEAATEANKLLDAFKVVEDVTDTGVLEIRSKEIEGALKLFSFDIGRFPTQDEGLKALVVNPGLEGWKGPYLANLAEADNTFRQFDYFCPGTNGDEFSLIPR